MISDYVRRHGPVVKGRGVVQFHHPKGRKYKHNKVLIGPWWIIPLPWELHDVASDNEFNVTHYPKRFIKEYGQQSILWLGMIYTLMNEGYTLPFSQDVIDAILDTRY